MADFAPFSADYSRPLFHGQSFASVFMISDRFPALIFGLFLVLDFGRFPVLVKFCPIFGADKVRLIFQCWLNHN
jgi:hypothetical protein